MAGDPPCWVRKKDVVVSMWLTLGPWEGDIPMVWEGRRVRWLTTREGVYGVDAMCRPREGVWERRSPRDPRGRDWVS